MAEELTKEQELLEKCFIRIVGDHLECDCVDTESRDALAKILEKEVLIRVKPKVQLEPIEKPK